MTYKITTTEDWGGDSKGTLTENIYYVDAYIDATEIGATEIEKAISIFKKNLEMRRNNRPQLNEWITNIERFEKITIL